MKKRKNFLLVIPAIILIGLVFIGAGQRDSGSGSSGLPPAGGPHIGYTLPLAPNGDTLRIFMGESTQPNISYAREPIMPFWQKLQDDTGVRVIWELAPMADHINIIQIRVAAGTDLPDISRLPPGMVMSWGNDGVLTPLNGLIDAYATNMLNWWFTDNPTMRRRMTTPEGEIYALPQLFDLNDPSLGTNPVNTLVRKDWLDDMGMKEPTTLEEFHAMLVAFKSIDPYGDGKVNVIPFHPHYGGPNFRSHMTFFSIGWAYGLHLFTSGGYYPNANGVMECEFIGPRFRELLTTLNQWWNEGLIDPSFMNYDAQRTTALVSNQEIGAYQNRMQNPANNYNTALKQLTGNPNAEYVPIVPLKGPYGDQFCENDFDPVGGLIWGIFNSSAKRELAMKWIDYAFFSPVMAEYNAYGIEGESFVWQDGVRVFTDKYVNHIDGLMNALKQLGAQHQTEIIGTTLMANPEFIRPRSDLFSRFQMISPYIAPFLALPLSTMEEDEIINRYSTDISTYADEMIIRFITGATPLSQYDEYVATLRRLGLDSIIAVQQSKYDRLSK